MRLQQIEGAKCLAIYGNIYVPLALAGSIWLYSLVSVSFSLE